MGTPAALRSLAAAAALALAAGAAAQTKPASEPATDGERVLGRWGFAFFGQDTFSFGSYAPPLGTAGPNTVSIYTVGVRRWMPAAMNAVIRNWGIDAGLGLVFGGGNESTGGASFDAPTAFGLALHTGLPLMLAHGRHVSFALIPEATLLLAGSRVTNPLAPDQRTDWSGLGLKLGARAGLEVYFGFVGIPQLALEATMGGSLSYTRVSSKPTGQGTSTSSRWLVATSRQNEPWSIFGGNVAALYYF
jgi:hypothetical protein